MSTKTAEEVAAELRCSTRKVTDVATQHGIGANLGGRAGFRFRDSDVDAIWEVLRPKTEAAPRRRRRAS